jgi:glucose/arabinose dehydrogenase
MEKPKSTWLRIFILAVAVVLAVASLPADAELTNRWSFNNSPGGAAAGTRLVDSISAATATVRGNGSTFTGAGLTITGSTTGDRSGGFISGYIDLPNGLISSRTHLSVELWATPLSAKNQARIFEFGRVTGSGFGGGAPGEIIDVNQTGQTPGITSGSDSIELTFGNGTNFNQQRMEARLNGANVVTVNSALPTSLGTRYHYVFTFQDGVGIHGSSGGRMTWYRNGTWVGSGDLAFRLSSVEDVNNWLGRSLWTADSNTHATYDELRLYDHALSPVEITTNFAAGPDSLVSPPEPVPAPVPDHLWTFTETAASEVASGRSFADSLGGVVATLRGNGAALTGTSLTLPGTSTGNQPASTISAYLDLPNGLISGQDSISLEAWATPLSSRNYQRLFDFGRTNLSSPGAAAGEIIDGAGTPGAFVGYDNLVLSLNVGGNLGTHRLEGQINNGAVIYSDTAAATVAGTAYHYVLTVSDGAGAFGASGSQTKWYRDGVLQNTLDLPFRLRSLADVNNWIGRSQYAGDSNSNLSLNEFRIYKRAISAGEVFASHQAGPDPSSGPPEPPVPAPLPNHRWSFNSEAGNVAPGSTFADRSAGETATLRGNGATLNGSALILPGTTNGNQNAATISAYLDLPNGILSSKTSVSFEAWATPLSSKTWQRLFDFGRSTITSGLNAAAGEIIDGPAAPGAYTAYDNLLLSLNNNGAFGSHRLEGRLNGGPTLTQDTDLASLTTAGTEYHYVLTLKDGAGSYGATGCQARWYRNATLQGTTDLNFRLAEMADVNNWIGRSQWAADMNSHLAINELRIYKHALSPGQITASLAAGANVVIPPPSVTHDSASLHPGQKISLKVLANDSGSIDPRTVEIVTPPATGSATALPSGEILFSHAGADSSPVSFSYRVSGEGGVSQAATVRISLSNTLRITNAQLNLPADPPPTAVQVVPAYPGASFTKPLAFASPPGDAKRLFVAELGGKLKVIPDVSAATASTSVVLDLATVISTPPRNPVETLKPGGNPECGLLGVAFHPDFASNGYFYVAYSVGKSNDDKVWFQRLSRFTIPAAQIGQAAPVADPSSERILIEQRDRVDNHNGGDLHFGPDGYLYWAVGDEANPNDIYNNSQRIDMNFFGAMVRIDVDKKPGNLEPNAHANPSAAALGYSSSNSIPRDEIPAGSGNFVARYSIPIDNPYVSTAQGGSWDGTFNGLPTLAENLPYIRSEFFAVGLRSPWRFSIDPASGEIWLGDVGQDAYEEVDLITKGGNYGWGFLEGTHPGPKLAPSGFVGVDPVYEYAHNNLPGDPNYKGNSIIGGVVYRGDRFSSLNGAYIFGDQVSGHIWALTRPGGVTTVQRIAGQAALATFGTDPSNGDVLVSDYNGGRIMRLITTTPATGFPNTLSATGLFADLADLSPAPGLLPYQPNLAFWSDHAVKRRWFSIPDPTAKMTWSRDGAWTYPSGQIWVKHFDMETERGNPAAPKKRIETRVLVKNDAGIYGVSYRWNQAGTDATLVGDAGEDFPIELSVSDAPYTQVWNIPSRSQCITCHSPQAGHALSFNTRQLNLDNTIHDFSGNQIELLRAAGYFTNTPESTRLLPRHLRPGETEYPLEARVRSYLDVNCAYCHAGTDGTAPSAWDGRHPLSLQDTGMVNAPSAVAKPPFKLIAPGSSAHSVILQRMAATGGFARMPPLGSSEIDSVNVQLVADWIEQSLTERESYDSWRMSKLGSNPLGEPTDDPDGDGATNQAEFLAGTDPTQGSSFLRPRLSHNGQETHLSFEIPANRSVQVEASDNLTDWSLWDVPDNDGTPRQGGPTHFRGPSSGARNFYRLLIREP